MFEREPQPVSPEQSFTPPEVLCSQAWEYSCSRSPLVAGTIEDLLAKAKEALAYCQKTINTQLSGEYKEAIVFIQGLLKQLDNSVRISRGDSDGI